MSLSKFLAFNAGINADDCVDRRGHEDVIKRLSRIVSLLGAANVSEACRFIDSLAISIGCPDSFTELGIHRQDQLCEIAASVNIQRMSNNPRKIDTPMIIQMLSQSLEVDCKALAK